VDVEKMIDDDQSARSIWEMIGGLDLSLYLGKIAAVEGRAGRDHTSPQLLISLWLYAYSRGISSAREIARRCEFEPAFQWLCGLQPISHRTLSGFRSDNHEALGSVFVQVVDRSAALAAPYVALPAIPLTLAIEVVRTTEPPRLMSGANFCTAKAGPLAFR
jgi:transposase